MTATFVTDHYERWIASCFHCEVRLLSNSSQGGLGVPAQYGSGTAKLTFTAAVVAASIGVHLMTWSSVRNQKSAFEGISSRPCSRTTWHYSNTPSAVDAADVKIKAGLRPRPGTAFRLKASSAETLAIKAD